MREEAVEETAHKKAQRRQWMRAISLGGIGIWSMHFIGMLALQLHFPHSSELVHHYFSPNWTALSFFIGILIVSVGFIIAGDPNHPKVWKNLFAGAAGGIGVSGMHYSGMAAMEGNFSVKWSAAYIITSVIIGIVAATAAMMILFRYGKYWASDLRMQAATSCIMGVAVCGMVRNTDNNNNNNNNKRRRRRRRTIKLSEKK